MQKDPKNIAFISIVSSGFALILFLWLPTFVTNVKSMTLDIGSSTKKIQTSLNKQSQEVFGDFSKQVTKQLQALEEKKQKQENLQEAMTIVIQKNLQNQALQSATSSNITPLETTSQSPNSSSTIRITP